MAEENNLKTDEKVQQRGLSKSAFPRLPLNKVILLAEKIYELGEGDPVPRLVVFDKLGKSPESGPSRMLVSTSNAYGLTIGSYQAERLGITERGKEIANPESVVQRPGLIVQTLLSNELFAKFHEKFTNRNIPSEPIGIDFLKQVGGLNDSDAKTAYRVFIENLENHGFIKEFSGSKKVVSVEMMGINIQNTAPRAIPATPDKDDSSNKSPSPPQEQKAEPRMQALQSALTPQFNFNIQIQIPDNASAETYDTIFKSIAEHLLKTNDR